VVINVTTPEKYHYTTLQNINFQKLFKETPAGELKQTAMRDSTA